jgi:hypothetical protein
MESSASEQTAATGIHAVRGAFTRIGWGTVENALHDLGTDLFLLARDAQGLELGLVVGAQVKTGPSYFGSPGQSENGRPGWWYAESSRTHFDMWASYGVPHLLVLHDLDTSASYWVHVTAEAIVSTGVGAKVLVPAANTVDAEHLDELLAVAASRLSGRRWEGSAWAGGPSLLPRDLLRHALIAPRLVAPHPNAGDAGRLTPEQAAALLAQVRPEALESAAAVQPEVPTLAEARESPEWLWRFVGAFGAWLIAGTREGFLAVTADAPSGGVRR